MGYGTEGSVIGMKRAYLLCLLALCKNKMSYFLCKKSSWEKEDEYWPSYLALKVRKKQCGDSSKESPHCLFLISYA